MGHITFKAIVFTDMEDIDDVENDAMHKLREFAIKNLPDVIRPEIVTSLYTGINGYSSFAILPDGSKEWWPASRNMDETIDKIIAELRRLNNNGGHIRYGYMQFADDLRAYGIETNDLKWGNIFRNHEQD